jgi:hypothetical protein
LAHLALELWRSPTRMIWTTNRKGKGQKPYLNYV